MGLSNLFFLSGWCELCGKLGWWEFSIVDPGSPSLCLLCANHHQEVSQNPDLRKQVWESRKTHSHPGTPIGRLIGGLILGFLLILFVLYLLLR